MNNKLIKIKDYKKNIIINNLSFRSKKQLKLYTKQLLNKTYNHNNKILKDENKDFSFMVELLKRNYYFNKNDINSLLVNKYNNSFNVVLLTKKKKKESISWIKCINNREKNETKRLSDMMRSIVKSFIKRFKKKHLIKHKKGYCSNCLQLFLSNELDVDHYNPEFNELKKSFFIKHDVITAINRKNKRFCNLWKQYHNNNCRLQLLCKKCHIKKNND